MFFGGKIYDVVWMLIHTTSGMDAHLHYIVGFSMLDAEDRNTCMSVTDHHQFVCKCLAPAQGRLGKHPRRSCLQSMTWFRAWCSVLAVLVASVSYTLRMINLEVERPVQMAGDLLETRQP